MLLVFDNTFISKIKIKNTFLLILKSLYIKKENWEHFLLDFKKVSSRILIFTVLNYSECMYLTLIIKVSTLHCYLFLSVYAFSLFLSFCGSALFYELLTTFRSWSSLRPLAVIVVVGGSSCRTCLEFSAALMSCMCVGASVRVFVYLCISASCKPPPWPRLVLLILVSVLVGMSRIFSNPT